MTKYNYAALSPQDFEEVTRDLLQAEWQVHLEAFKAGRDTGIDLRYSATNDVSVIIQCKHYLASGFDKLLSHLKHVELHKVRRLAPSRYVVATTVALSPLEKDKIIEALSPFIKSTADVLGANDIDGLLSKHPDIERANFKLWLTSTSVLDRIIHNAEISRTDFEVERVRKKLPLFVQNEAFPKAKQMLAETKVLVISGTPGIGKTTLAEMLLYSHLEEGYEPVVIQGEIAEGRKLFRNSVSQIFYYDDFLGQTYFGDRKEFLGRNEDKAIVDFMEMVRAANDSRFVLTTREHILSGATRLSARLGENPILRDRIVLTLENYTFGEKARMLYNHLYFSDLPQSLRDALLVDDFFLSVIKHPHFNPRLIEWLSSYSRVKSVSADQFSDHVGRLLDNPEKIWDHAFHEQISEPARNVILSMAATGTVEQSKELEPIFDALHAKKARKYNFRIASADFRNALREVDGAFLRYSNGYVLFLNPSIKEYVAGLVCADHHISQDIWESLVRFKQLITLWRLASQKPDSALATYLRDLGPVFFERMMTLIDAPYIIWTKSKEGASTIRIVDCEIVVRLTFIAEYCEELKNTDQVAIACAAMHRIVTQWSATDISLSNVPKFLEGLAGREWFMSKGGIEIYQLAISKILGDLHLASATNWCAILDLRDAGICWKREYDDSINHAFGEFTDFRLQLQLDECTSLDDKKSAIATLEMLGQKAGADFSSSIDALEQDVAGLEQEEEEPAVGLGAPSMPVESLRRAYVSDEDVRQMFSTLAADSTP